MLLDGGGSGGLYRQHGGRHCEFSVAGFMRKDIMKSSCGRPWRRRIASEEQAVSARSI